MKSELPTKTPLQLWMEHNNYTPIIVEMYDAYGLTPEDAAKRFAMSYWDKPREITQTYPSIKVGNNTLWVDGYFFEVEYGVKPWEVVFVPGVHLVSIPMFHIVRYDVKKVEEEE